MLKRFKLFYLVILITFLANAAFPTLSSATTSITITSPTSGQTFSGNDFTISGSTDPNSTVLIIKGTTVLKQTISDGSGNFTINLSNLPDGNNSITAKVLKNKGYAYFNSTPDGNSFNINRLRFSDDAINPGGGGWPQASTKKLVALLPQPNSSIYWGFASQFDTAQLPAWIDVNSPTDPTNVTGSYPSNPAANLGTYNADGSRLYMPNLNNNYISVINTFTKGWVKNIDLGSGGANYSAVTGPNGKIYVARQNNTLRIINPTDDSVSDPFTESCKSILLSFSDDPTYPYYYGYCQNDAKIVQFKLSDNTENAVWDVPGNPTGGYLTYDNSKIYYYSSTFAVGTDGDKIHVISTKNSQNLATIQLAAGALGFIGSPDGQYLYIGTPGNSLTSHNIDKVNLSDNSVTHIPLNNEGATALTFDPASDTAVAIANVGVVLGVKTTSTGSLGKTGTAAVSSTVLVALIATSLAYTYYDYRRHKKPLVDADSDAKRTYTYAHHVKSVTLPLLRYRLGISLTKFSKSDEITKF